VISLSSFANQNVRIKLDITGDLHMNVQSFVLSVP
jgi:hypothetical protein